MPASSSQDPTYNGVCTTIDKNISQQTAYDGLDLGAMITTGRPHLFSDAMVCVPGVEIRKQQELISVLAKVIAMPAYQQRVLEYAPAIAQFAPKADGVFLGYDFHVSPSGSKLIEINTNAGGALLNAVFMRANANGWVDLDVLLSQDLGQTFLAMFRQEWRAERVAKALQTIAIVDAGPLQQYMLPEFILFKKLFEYHGIQTIICDPAELLFKQGRLWHGGTCIDLVYNRHTDFSFESAELQPLAQAYLANAVVVTPHPRAHALYADKRNLALLSDPLVLAELGVDPITSHILQAGIAKTHWVKQSDAGALWAGRKHLFFKPAKGYGSKAAYRGDKLTQRVFAEILQGNYVAQMLAPPGILPFMVNGKEELFKWDLRHYVYQDDIQMTVARLYQGQTTNFRTLGGGFAKVVMEAD